MQVPPDAIAASPYQTRAAESEEELAGLAASIAARIAEGAADGND